MSEPSRWAWTVCRTVTERFGPEEREVIRTHFTTTWDGVNEKTPYQTTADRYGLTTGETRRIVERCIRMVTVERGLADE